MQRPDDSFAMLGIGYNFQVVLSASDQGSDSHWLVLKIGDTGTAIYSENSIAWDIEEFGRQRAANERPIRQFEKSVPGLNNLWIVHSEQLTNDLTFDSFVEKGGYNSVKLVSLITSSFICRC